MALTIAEDNDRSRVRARARGLPFTAAIAAFLVPSLSAAVVVNEIEGRASVKNPSNMRWSPAVKNYVLTPGEEVRTFRKGKIELNFEDGSKVEIGPKSSFVLRQATKTQTVLGLKLGRLKAWVKKASNRRFSVRTPTAVCSVRGTEFGVDVGRGGETRVDLFEGLLGVGDGKGNETLLNTGQSIGVDKSGLGAPMTIGEADKRESDAEREGFKREVQLAMSKEDVMSAAAEEAKDAVYKEGKVMVDVNGNRVRLEEYIIRSQSNQFKLVVLNERPDRFDYFYYKGTFNAALPEDLRVAFRQLPGCIGAACSFYLTNFETGRSNTTDAILENADNGHMVDVNNNGTAGDEVDFAFNTETNDFQKLAGVTSGTDGGTPFFKTLFDNYNLTFNGVSHLKWAPQGGVTAATLANCPTGVCGAGIGIRSYKNPAQFNDLNTVKVHDLDTSNTATPDCNDLEHCTMNREPGLFHDVIYEQNTAGTIWDKWDNYIISDEGKIAKHSDFAGVTSGADFKGRLLHWNYQQIITASEFNGRKIDLVFEPKILIESGLIP